MPVRCLLIACVKELMNSCLAKSLTILSTYCRLPSQREQHCEPRQRVHNFQHPTQSSHFLTVTISCECCLRMSLDVHYQPQSVAEISHHSVLSGGRIRQCETSRPRRCLTLSNPAPWQNWMVAYLGYTLRMRTLFHGWPIMVNDTHTRRRRTGCALSTASILWHFITVLDTLYYFPLYWHYLAAFCLLFYEILVNEWMEYRQEICWDDKQPLTSCKPIVFTRCEWLLLIPPCYWRLESQIFDGYQR